MVSINLIKQLKYTSNFVKIESGCFDIFSCKKCRGTYVYLTEIYKYKYTNEYILYLNDRVINKL